jgi:hypothetical protein
VSEVRFSEFVPFDPLPPLVDYAAVKEWYALTPATPELKVQVSMDAISAAIRDYTGRILSKGQFIETFENVREDTTCRYLREIPIDMSTPPLLNAGMGDVELTVLNARSGRVQLLAGPRVRVTYTAGYATLPSNLQIVFMELLRLQMAQLGEDQFGNSTTTSPQEKAVWVGTLKVEYAVSATSEQSKAASAGGITAAALAPWANVLDEYRALGKMVAT